METLTVTEFLSVPDGARVLDLGCGYGDIARFFVDRCSYLGIDSNESYVKEARRRNSQTNAEFLLADLSDEVVKQRGPFDLVILSGVLHHLTSEQVIALASASEELLSPTGRFVAIEPVFTPDQRLSARLIIASDRGRYVRDVDGYKTLLSKGFANVDGSVVHGRLRIPYSHVVLTCSR
jgi:cyclopropane fatty-acyl-phospholipid synthase-like methyltransferase